jgi:outer membrane lipoprotein-sorting protein
MSKKVLVVLCLFFGSLIAQAATPAETAQVLRQLNDAAKNFHTAKATFSWVETRTLPIPDEVTQNGSIAFKREGGSIEMAAHILGSDGKVAKELVYTKGALNVYEPNIKQLSVYTAGNNRSMYESFLTLGFGGSGDDLEKGWLVTDVKHEKIDGVEVARLNLVSKNEGVRKTFKNVILWIDVQRGVSLKQQFFQTDGSVRTANYSKIELNTKLRSDAFNVNTATGTKTVSK